MALPASSVMAMPEAGHLEQLPVGPAPDATGPLPVAADPPAPAISPLAFAASPPAPVLGDSRVRPLEMAVCSLCGTARPLGLLVPDGSPAHADVHWYCKDVRSCTERWTTAR
jgi:hypothetical protein